MCLSPALNPRRPFFTLLRHGHVFAFTVANQAVARNIAVREVLHALQNLRIGVFGKEMRKALLRLHVGFHRHPAADFFHLHHFPVFGFKDGEKTG